MTLSYTQHLKLAVPDFLSEPWHSEFAEAMNSIDRAMFENILATGADLWLNSTVYAIGDLVISPDNGSMYTAAVAHTSSAAPQTFTQELAAFPGRWTAFALTLATQAEAEAGAENTHYMSPLRVAQAIDAQGAVPGFASQAQAEAGVDNTVMMSPLRTLQSIKQFAEPPGCGRLVFSSATALQFAPFAGDKIHIGGEIYEIPAAGIAGLGNTNVIVNGVAGQNLVLNTTYWVFAKIVGGVITADFRTVGTHAPSTVPGIVGVEVLTVDNALSLIGMCRTNASAQFVNTFTQRFVISWFNRRALPCQGTNTAGATTTAVVPTAEFTTAARCEFLTWTEEGVFLALSGNTFNSIAANNFPGLGFDGVNSNGLGSGPFGSQLSGGNAYMNGAGMNSTQVAEGYHFITPVGYTSGGTMTANLSALALIQG